MQLELDAIDGEQTEREREGADDFDTGRLRSTGGL